MASIYFVGPYKPIICGIADYTEFVTKKLNIFEWGVLTFDLHESSLKLMDKNPVTDGHIWYGIPNGRSITSQLLLDGLKSFNVDLNNSVLWFQHEFGIWPDTQQLVNTLRNLDTAKIITLHTVHFQDKETPFGMKKRQYDLLKLVLPLVDAITVFSRGAYQAVVSAFPQYAGKVHILKHGIHHYPEILELTSREAKFKLHDYLLNQSDISPKAKKRLKKNRIFLDEESVVIGQTGFLVKHKGSKLLFSFKKKLQKIINSKKLASVRIGGIRESRQKPYVEQLKQLYDNNNSYIIEAWLPPDILPVAQRAFDINFYWPDNCTQSGILAHALGAGAITAGRQLEGFGEILSEAGGIVEDNYFKLVSKSAQILSNPILYEAIESSALSYSHKHSWGKKALEHVELAQQVLQNRKSRSEKPLKKLSRVEEL